jgi:hypothetical protein
MTKLASLRFLSLILICLISTTPVLSSCARGEPDDNEGTAPDDSDYTTETAPSDPEVDDSVIDESETIDFEQIVDSVLNITDKMFNVAHFADDRPVVDLINGTSINYVNGGDPYIKKPSGETITATDWNDVEFRIDEDAPGLIRIEFDRDDTINGLIAESPAGSIIWSDDDEANRGKKGIVKLSYEIGGDAIRGILEKGAFSGPRNGKGYEEAFLGDLAEVVLGDKDEKDYQEVLIDVTTAPLLPEEGTEGYCPCCEYWVDYSKYEDEAGNGEYPGETTAPSPEETTPTPSTEEITEPPSEEPPEEEPKETTNCIKYPKDIIPGRGFFDFLRKEGEGGSFNFDLNDIRYKPYGASALSKARELKGLIDMTVGDLAGVDCSNYSSTDYDLKLPDFPADSLKFEFDLCNHNKVSSADNIGDFITEDSDLQELNDWVAQVNDFADNFGNLTDYAGDPMLDHWWEKWGYHQAKIVEHDQAMKDELDTMLRLRYNRCDALKKTIGFVIGAAVTVATAGSGTAALVSSLAFFSAVEMGGVALESSGADPQLIHYLKQAIIFGKGAAAGGLSGTTAGLLKEASIAASMIMVNEKIWNTAMEDIEKCYPGSGFRIEEIRNKHMENVMEEIEELCKIHNDVENALNQIESELNRVNTQTRGYINTIKDEFEDLNNNFTLDCICCEWSDGSGPDDSCSFTIPRS